MNMYLGKRTPPMNNFQKLINTKPSGFFVFWFLSFSTLLGKCASFSKKVVESKAHSYQMHCFPFFSTEGRLMGTDRKERERPSPHLSVHEHFMGSFSKPGTTCFSNSSCSLRSSMFFSAARGPVQPRKQHP